MAIERRYRERKPYRVGIGTHVFLMSCVALVATFFAWSAIGKLDVVSAATGEVVPSSQLKTVQHLEGGIVRQILVREGDKVKQGQSLVELEPTKSVADVDELVIRMRSLRVNIARLEAEVAGDEAPTFPEDIVANEPTLTRQMLDLFKTRQRRLEGQMAAQRELMIQRQQEINEVQVRLRNNATALKLVEEQLTISNRLLKLDLTNRMQHLNLLKEHGALKGKIEEDNAHLPKTRAALNEASRHLETIRTVFQEEARKELEETRRTLKELQQRMVKYEDSLRRTVLRAPVDGTVKTIYVATQGGVIQAGATVLDIVPADDRLVIEAKLQTQDIGFVRAGQDASIQLASAEAARFGMISGKVVAVSPDTFVTKQGVPFYKVRIETDKAYFERGQVRFDLFPGMQVQTSILTGARTVLAYLLDPYVTSMRSAMRER